MCNSRYYNYFIVILIVIILIGIGFFSVVNLNKKAKDAERISDMTILQMAMSIIKKETGDYASSNCSVGAIADCAKVNNKLIEALPVLADFHDPEYQVGDAPCSSKCDINVCDYAFADIGEDDYTVYFNLQKGVQNYEVGCYELTSKGIAKINK